MTVTDEEIPLPEQEPEIEDLVPCNPMAEEAVVGAVLLDPNALTVTTELITPDDFYSISLQTIYVVALEMFAEGTPLDAVSVMHELMSRKLIERVGGAPRLHTLMSGTPTAANVAYYCGLVAEAAEHRRVYEAGQRLMQLGMGRVEGAGERARATVEEALQRADRGQSGAWLGDVLGERLDEYDTELERGLLSGWHDLDDILNAGRGVLPGQSVLIGALPGVGKSLMLVNWLRSIAATGARALLASVEMTRGEVVDRILAAEAKVFHSALTAHRLDHYDRPKVHAAAERLADMPLRIEDSAHLGVGKLRAIASGMAQHPDGLDVIGVDYVQIMEPADTSVAREQQVAQMSRGLKVMAKDFSCTVISAAQLNRDVEKRSDGVPKLSDLRETGALGQDADIVLLLFLKPDDPDRLYVLIAKHRGGGGVGTVIELGYATAMARINSLSHHDYVA